MLGSRPGALDGGVPALLEAAQTDPWFPDSCSICRLERRQARLGSGAGRGLTEGTSHVAARPALQVLGSAPQHKRAAGGTPMAELSTVESHLGLHYFMTKESQCGF